MTDSNTFLSPEKTHVLWFELDLTLVGLVGLLGNCFWFLRFFHQWVVSERRKESVIPVMFWYWSLLGTFCLGTYFVITGNIPGTLAYAPNAFVYIRNLMLIRRKRRLQLMADAAGETIPAASGEEPGEERSSARRNDILLISILVGLPCLILGAGMGIVLARALAG